MGKYKIIPSSRTIVQSPISIGHKAEKGVEAIEFDLTAWVETYGSGTLTVIMRRWGDAIPYPIALEIDENNKATWTLSDIDTAKAGMAYAQLNYIVGGEVVKKSDIYTFRVMDSLTGEGDPPEAYESWLENLTRLAAEAMAEVLDIEGIVTDKTLTVDGGIADAKKTGDELSALKADLGNKAYNAFAYCESGYFIMFSDYNESPVQFNVRTYNFYVSINNQNYAITPQNILDAATAAGLTIDGTIISGTSWALYLDMSGSTPTVKALKSITNSASVAILTKNVVLFAGHFKSFRYGLFVDYQTQRKAETAYNKSTTNAENIATNAANIATNAENIGTALSAIDASIIPSYFETNLTAKIPLIIENMNTAGANGTTFVFITDIHWETNYRKSPALIKCILDKTSVKNVFCGGDIINQGQKADMYSVFLECINQYRYIPTNGFFPIARGNHDDNSNWSSSSDVATYAFDGNTIYNLLYSQVADKCVRFGSNWSFYYDDVTRKTRFIFADTKRNGATIDVAQIVSVLNSVASGWHVIFIMHFTLKSNTAFYDGCEVLAHIVKGYNDRENSSYTGSYQTVAYDFTNAVGTVDLIIGGHTHADYSMDADDENNPSGVPVIATDTDSYRNHTGTEGTVNSQCFDVVTVDYTAKTVKCVRIGRGSDRTFSY